MVPNRQSRSAAGVKHEKTGEAYVVIFTDCHNIRDYKKGVVPVLGELYQEDVDLITGKS
ncbi:Uncharacterised protein [Shigella sonnei]|uniref:hypothetical protein n=1 Tax=Escherichia coli TaxID=562 RepID=UPI0006637A19|nr:Uncharacterised protein [Shigella sonnei]